MQTKQKNIYQPFCYRGAKITAEEFRGLFENIGQFVRNLGFLSASKDKNVALNFMDNALIEIHMSKLSKFHLQDSYGFADIESFSEYFR